MAAHIRKSNLSDDLTNLSIILFFIVLPQAYPHFHGSSTADQTGETSLTSAVVPALHNTNTERVILIILTCFHSRSSQKLSGTTLHLERHLKASSPSSHPHNTQNTLGITGLCSDSAHFSAGLDTRYGKDRLYCAWSRMFVSRISYLSRPGLCWIPRCYFGISTSLDGILSAS